MSFDVTTINAAIAEHGVVTRVLVAGVEGSAPREAGASMLVWEGGQSGTIGGGTLEFEAARDARKGGYFRRIPLGPAIGQCCGGAVTLLAERFEAQIEQPDDGIHARRFAGEGEMPLKIKSVLKAARSSGQAIDPIVADGWVAETVSNPARHLWVYGAGHVGRAIVNVLSPLPEFAITWVDTGADRFPAHLPNNVTQLVAANPADVVQYAPRDAEHIILTYSHALDLELCHRALLHGFSFAGLIGSATKWARFKKRLAALGHTSHQIARITCPIGDPLLGKHPQAIALGVGTELLKTKNKHHIALGETA